MTRSSSTRGGDDSESGRRSIRSLGMGKEKKSTIENGIAERSPVFDGPVMVDLVWHHSEGIMLVVVLVAVVSIATLALAFPLVAGRTVYSLLRIPDQTSTTHLLSQWICL